VVASDREIWFVEQEVQLAGVVQSGIPLGRPAVLVVLWQDGEVQGGRLKIEPDRDTQVHGKSEDRQHDSEQGEVDHQRGRREPLERSTQREVPGRRPEHEQGDHLRHTECYPEDAAAEGKDQQKVQVQGGDAGAQQPHRVSPG
jgi:hypothetical protein